MSHIWSFSDDSKEILQQCLNAAANAPPDSNKWLQKFGPRNFDLLKKVDDSIIIQDSPEMDNTPAMQVNQEKNILNAIEMFTDPDYDLVTKFEILKKKCLTDPTILTKLAKTLSTITIDKLTHYIFDSKGIDENFLEHFYEFFLPVYIKKENSRACIDSLIKAYKLHPQHFKTLLKSLLKDLEVQNNILNDFILTLDRNSQSEFVINVANLELSGDEFSHNLFNIYTAYKSCNKTVKVQNHVFSLIKTYSQHCTIDKNYGKLFLAFLQQEKSLKTIVNKIELEVIIETHKSPFRRPCIAVLKEINDN